MREVTRKYAVNFRHYGSQCVRSDEQLRRKSIVQWSLPCRNESNGLNSYLREKKEMNMKKTRQAILKRYHRTCTVSETTSKQERYSGHAWTFLRKMIFSSRRKRASMNPRSLPIVYDRMALCLLSRLGYELTGD